MMKKVCWIASLIALLIALFPLSTFAASVDYERLTRAELEQIVADAEGAIKRNHSVSSSVSNKLSELTKLNIVRLMTSLQNEPQWRWVDWKYERAWNQLKVKTEAKINDALQPVNATYIDEGEGIYQLAFLQVGEQILFRDTQSTEADVPQSEITSATEATEPADADMPEPEDAPIAKRGDKNDTVKSVQQMLIRLDFLNGTADGSFGAGTEKAVKAFRSANGFTEDGVVTQSVYRKMEENAALIPEAEEVISITAKQLFSAYDTNEFAADEKYDGKQLKVSGMIDSIDTDIWGTPYITLSTGKYSFFSVQCYFGRGEKSDLAKLKKGNNIVIRGRCDGWSGNILISECKIVG